MKSAVMDELKFKIHHQFQSSFKTTIDNPVMKAYDSWEILSEQLEALLGSSVFRQWFLPIRPLVLKNHILILQAENAFAAGWITTHYQELIDSLILLQDKRLQCFIIGRKPYKHKT